MIWIMVGFSVSFSANTPSPIKKTSKIIAFQISLFACDAIESIIEQTIDIHNYVCREHTVSFRSTNWWFLCWLMSCIFMMSVAHKHKSVKMKSSFIQYILHVELCSALKWIKIAYLHTKAIANFILECKLQGKLLSFEFMTFLSVQKI